MVLDAVDPNRLERAVADVQRDVGAPDARRCQAVEKPVVRCSPAVGAAIDPRALRVHGLVPLAVARIVGAVDVGRQRHVSDGVDDALDVVAVLAPEPDRSAAVKVLLEHLGPERRSPAPSNTTRAPGWSFCPGCMSASHRSPSMRRTSRHSTAPPVGSRWPSSRAGKTLVLLSDEQVALAEEVGQGRDRGVSDDGAGRPVENEQARRVPFGDGLLGDLFGRQMEVEQGHVHRDSVARQGATRRRSAPPDRVSAGATGDPRPQCTTGRWSTFDWRQSSARIDHISWSW